MEKSPEKELGWQSQGRKASASSVLARPLLLEPLLVLDWWCWLNAVRLSKRRLSASCVTCSARHRGRTHPGPLVPRSRRRQRWMRVPQGNSRCCEGWQRPADPGPEPAEKTPFLESWDSYGLFLWDFVLMNHISSMHCSYKDLWSQSTLIFWQTYPQKSNSKWSISDF